LPVQFAGASGSAGRPSDQWSIAGMIDVCRVGRLDRRPGKMRQRSRSEDRLRDFGRAFHRRGQTLGWRKGRLLRTSNIVRDRVMWPGKMIGAQNRQTGGG
jgi:hypothetical protein